MPEYVMGIADEANRLRGLGIDPGEPTEDEQPIHSVPGGTQTHALQFSTKGVFMYSTASNKVWFLPGAGS